MSGHKRATVSLSEFDLNRLENIESKLRQVEIDYEAIRNRSKKKQENELDKNLKDLVYRQENLSETFQSNFSALNNELQSEIHYLDEKNTNEIISQTQILHDRILELEDTSWNQTINLISEYQEVLDQQSNSFIREFQSRIELIEQDLYFREQDKENYTNDFLKTAQILYENLKLALPVEQYYPGLLTSLSTQFDMATVDIQHHMIDSGLSLVQQAILKLIEIQQEITKRETSRKSLLTLANRKINEIIELAKINRFISAVDLDGNKLDINIDVGFWSGSLYKKTLRKAIAYQDQLNKNGDKYSSEELADLISKTYATLEENFSDAYFDARRNVIASQVRFNIAGSVIQALKEQGFLLNGGRYVESDQRGSYQALLKHIDGSEVVVQVSELEGEVGTSQIDLETLNPHLYTQHELRQRAKELAVSLMRYGLNLGKIPSKTLERKPFEYNYKPEEFQPSKKVREEQATYGRI